MALSMKTINYLRAEKLNRVEQNRFQNRLNFLDWQHVMRSKHYDDRMEKLRVTIQLLNKSTGVSKLKVQYYDAEEDKKSKYDQPYQSELSLGNRRFWLTGPGARGQPNLNRVKTPIIHSSRTSNEMTAHLGWKSEPNDLVADSLEHPFQLSDEPYNEVPLTKSFGPVKPADCLGRTINKVGLSTRDHDYLINTFRSDQKICKCAQRTNYVSNKIDAMQQRKSVRNILLQDMEKARNDPFYGLE